MVSGGSVVQTISSVGVKGAKIISVFEKDYLIRIQFFQKLKSTKLHSFTYNLLIMSPSQIEPYLVSQVRSAHFPDS